MVWVSCQGENPADRENIGPIQYLPYRGFPGYYFPYTNQEGYLSPLVAVHLQRPK
ncbi:jg22124, partial [Pararge aegeria aegeria]